MNPLHSLLVGRLVGTALITTPIGFELLGDGGTPCSPDQPVHELVSPSNGRVDRMQCLAVIQEAHHVGEPHAVLEWLVPVGAPLEFELPFHDTHGWLAFHGMRDGRPQFEGRIESRTMQPLSLHHSMSMLQTGSRTLDLGDGRPFERLDHSVPVDFWTFDLSDDRRWSVSMLARPIREDDRLEPTPAATWRARFGNERRAQLEGAALRPTAVQTADPVGRVLLHAQAISMLLVAAGVVILLPGGVLRRTVAAAFVVTLLVAAAHRLHHHRTVQALNSDDASTRIVASTHLARNVLFPRASAEAIADRFDIEPDVTVRRAMLLALAGAPSPASHSDAARRVRTVAQGLPEFQDLFERLERAETAAQSASSTEPSGR